MTTGFGQPGPIRRTLAAALVLLGRHHQRMTDGQLTLHHVGTIITRGMLAVGKPEAISAPALLRPHHGRIETLKVPFCAVEPAVPGSEGMEIGHAPRIKDSPPADNPQQHNREQELEKDLLSSLPACPPHAQASPQPQPPTNPLPNPVANPLANAILILFSTSSPRS